ncbi:MAG: hypothetical protein ACXW5U_05020 [Thermoanaerobaculia bacterium]
MSDLQIAAEPLQRGFRDGADHAVDETGLPYMDIRKQWERLMVIASRMLRYNLEDKKRTFFNFRHTDASHIAQRGKTPAHLLAVVQMMGDTSVATVNRHYFKMEPELMRELVLGWKRPDVDVPSVAAADRRLSGDGEECRLSGILSRGPRPTAISGVTGRGSKKLTSRRRIPAERTRAP